MTANPLTPIPPIGPTTAVGPTPVASRFKPLDPLKILRQYTRLLVITGVVGIVLGVVIWYSLLKTAPSYQSSATLIVTPPQNPLTSTGTDQLSVGGNNQGLELFIRTQVYQIMSEDVISTVIKREDVRATQWFQAFGQDTQKARESLQEDLKSMPVTGTQLIKLTMNTREPKDAQVILEAVMDVYLNQLSINRLTQNSRILSELRRMGERLDEEIRLLNDRMRDYRQRNDLARIEVQNQEATVEYNMLIEEDTKLRFAADQAKASYMALAKAQQEGVILEASPEELKIVENDPAIRTRDERLRQLREERDIMVQRFGENHRAIVEIDLRMEATRQERKRELDRLLAAAQAVKLDISSKNANALESAVLGLRPKLEEARARVTDLTTKLQEYKFMEESLVTAKERRSQVDENLYIRQAQESAGGNVSKQTAPTTPNLTFPRVTVVVPGVTFLFVGAVVGLIFLVEMLDQRVKSPSDVKMLPNAELLGVLPDGAEDPSGNVPIENVVKHYPTGLMAESFRHVRTALLTRMDRRGYKTLVVVGAKPGSGTSAVVGNLALSLAYNGRKVLVIDANFRRPAQHQMFDVPREPGLVDVLQHGISVERAIRQVSEPAMSVLPAGTGEDAPPELLEGPQFRRMLTTFEAQYDMVLIDAPPALLASEGQLLAKHVDALALVVRAMSDKRGMVERMLRVLDGQRADVLGIVLNGVRSTAGGYLRQSYQEFYRYRSGASSKAAYGAARRAMPEEPAASGNGHDEPTNGSRADDITDEDLQAQLDRDDDPRHRA